ncbi:MAG: hypothetical protein QOE33_3714 [Acidobacteriota bacterium]|jgi:hypothetical protein|nr:hypothetical protein [Acidobacteriota bacterium]
MLKSYPELDDYECLWPLDIMLINQLKYSTSALKGSGMKKAVADVRTTLAMTAAHQQKTQSQP